MPTEISVFLLSLQAMPLKLTTYYRGSKVPDLPGTNTFHSTELFRIYEDVYLTIVCFIIFILIGLESYL